jgi:YegS/Rv2252/BmrU family lipid kinase
VKQALIISNPMAARVDDSGLREAQRRLTEGGLAVAVARTTAPGHAERLARAASSEGIDLLIAHGGDGTVMEVASALIGTDRPIGLLPAGTGNLLAGNLGIRRSARAAAEVILAGNVRTIDVGRLETSAGVRYFSVAAGMGFDAELMHRTPSRRKRAFGVGAYLTTAVGLATAITRANLRIETENRTIVAPAATVLIANCREIIPGVLPLAENGIEPDDGVLNVVVMDATTLPQAARVAWRLLLRNAQHDPGVTYLAARHVKITPDRELPVQADGEACGHSPLTIDVVPRGLAVLAPGRGAA